MSIVEKLKAKSLELRKARNPISASIVFALSEIEKVGKNSGNRATTEDEAIKVVQKLIATIDQNITLAKDDGRKVAFGYEKQILSAFLPEMASDKDILEMLNLKLNSMQATHEKINKGDVLKAVRAQFGSKVDMKRATQILQETFGV